MRRSLEDILLEEQLLDEGRLRQVRRHARHAGISLARAAVEEAKVSDEALAEAVARRLRLPRVDLKSETIDEEAIREVPHDLADRRRLLPLSLDRAGARPVMRVAMADPLDIDAVDEIEMSTGYRVEPLVGTVGELGAGVQRHYRGVITKMIPRAPFGIPANGLGTPAARGADPVTQPHHVISEEAAPELRLRALVDLLVERGAIDREAYDEAVRRLVRQTAGE